MIYLDSKENNSKNSFGVMNKALWAIFLFSMLIPMHGQQIHKNESLEAWVALSASCQNLNQKVQRMKGGQDPSSFEPELSAIDASLKRLVVLGHLKHKTLKIKYSGNFDKTVELIGFPDNLINQYGVYISAEMAGLGKFYRDPTMLQGDVLLLEVYLPEDVLNKVLESISREKLRK